LIEKRIIEIPSQQKQTILYLLEINKEKND
jgi:hypothetical protein